MNRDQHDRDKDVDLRDIAALIAEADEQVSTLTLGEHAHLLQIADLAVSHRRRNVDEELDRQLIVGISAVSPTQLGDSMFFGSVCKESRVAQARATADEIVAEAKVRAATLLADAADQTHQAERNAQAKLRKAQADADTIRAQAEFVLRAAERERHQAQRLLLDAEREAEQTRERARQEMAAQRARTARYAARTLQLAEEIKHEIEQEARAAAASAPSELPAATYLGMHTFVGRQVWPNETTSAVEQAVDRLPAPEHGAAEADGLVTTLVRHWTRIFPEQFRPGADSGQDGGIDCPDPAPTGRGQRSLHLAKTPGEDCIREPVWARGSIVRSQRLTSGTDVDMQFSVGVQLYFSRELLRSMTWDFRCSSALEVIPVLAASGECSPRIVADQHLSRQAVTALVNGGLSPAASERAAAHVQWCAECALETTIQQLVTTPPSPTTFNLDWVWPDGRFEEKAPVSWCWAARMTPVILPGEVDHEADTSITTS